MDPDPAQKQLADLRPRPLAPVVLVELRGDLFLPLGRDNIFPLDRIGDGPALVAVETKDQRGNQALVVTSGVHPLEELRQKLIADPLIGERDLPLVAGDQCQFSLGVIAQPGDEIVGVPDRGGDQQGPDMFGEKFQGKFPDDPPLGVGELVKLVHHHHGDIVEPEVGLFVLGGDDPPPGAGGRFPRRGAGVMVGGVFFFLEQIGAEQPVKENLGDDDQDLRVGVLAAVSGDQADVRLREAPELDLLAQLAELLFGQRDQRGGVVGALARFERLVEPRLGDDGLAHAGRGADQDPLIGIEPGEDRFFLERIRFERERIEVLQREGLPIGNLGGRGIVLGGNGHGTA